ncbi:TPA: tail fiber assembly protein [Escherichia coli]|nr:tail fiber assembly protein [Escherichia coli]
MNHFKNFTPYTPETPHAEWALYLISEDGHDWYECQKLFAEDTYKIVYDKNNIVRSIATDVSALCPVDASVAELASLPEGADINGGWYYRDGEVLPVPVDYSQQAEKQRQRLLTEAGDIISDWKTELELGIISDEDRASLTQWMAYIKSLKALDLSQVSDETSFNSINWPERPDAAA